jgi:type IV pilus assembly protein PilA
MAITGRASNRGFTLAELLTVVAMIGVLAAIAVAFVGKYVRSARTAEALAMVQSIRAAEASYRAENRRYLSTGATLTDYYPAQTPDPMKRAFYQNGSAEKDRRWNMLHPTVAGPVRFGYSVIAGDSGDAVPVPNIQNPPNFATPTGPFFVIQAAGDTDGNQQYCMVVATSFSPETYVENEGE